MSYGYFDFKLNYWKKFKISLCEAQNWRCCYCKFRVELIPGKTDRQDSATLEHIKTRYEGGQDTYENLVIACKLCNEARNRGNCYRFERVVTQLLQNPLIRAAWHKFDDRLFRLLKMEIEYFRHREKAAEGKPSAVRNATRYAERHRTLVNLVSKNII